MTAALDDEAYADHWRSWHDEHEIRRARPHGFLAITSMHWLDIEPQRFVDAPGTWSRDGLDVRVDLNDDENLEIDGVRYFGHHVFTNVDESGFLATFADIVVEVCRRDDELMIRPRDPKNPTRSGYAGTPTFPPSIRWVVDGTFEPLDAPRSITVATSAEGLTHVFESCGDIRCEIEQTTVRLTTFNDEDPDELFIVFTDLTSGSTTYGACRFLSVAAPGPDGGVVVDFNRATNPPCAYTDFTTCPLPPRTNHLNVRVEAGEMLPFGP